MSQHHAEVFWERGDQSFLDNRYSRRHLLRFDGGAEIAASSSPQVVPAPWSDPAAVDPEEMLVAAISNCHMLWFLSLAVKAGFRVDRYHDRAVGTMKPNARGKVFLALVTLRPDIVFSGDPQPDATALNHLNHRAHEECFIANSVLTEIRIAAPEAAP